VAILFIVYLNICFKNWCR